SYEDWRILLPELVNNAQHIITQHCIRGQGTAAKLTYTSYSIGLAVMRTLGWEEDPYKALALGDIFLEAFYQTGIIDIYRESDKWRAPYLIQLEVTPDYDRSDNHLCATSDLPLGEINGL